MTYTTALPSDVIVDYLRQKFDWAQMEETPTGAASVEAGEGSERWHLTVSREFLESHRAEDVRRIIEDWNLAGEMRRTEGLALSVSSAGVRLESSN